MRDGGPFPLWKQLPFLKIPVFVCSQWQTCTAAPRLPRRQLRCNNLQLILETTEKQMEGSRCCYAAVKRLRSASFGLRVCLQGGFAIIKSFFCFSLIKKKSQFLFEFSSNCVCPTTGETELRRQTKTEYFFQEILKFEILFSALKLQTAACQWE